MPRQEPDAELSRRQGNEKIEIGRLLVLAFC